MCSSSSAAFCHARPIKTLFFSLDHMWQETGRQTYCDQLIAVGGLVSRSLQSVIEHHLITHTPIILEGDGLVPEAAADYVRANDQRVRALFLTEDDEQVVQRNMRGWGCGLTPAGEASAGLQLHMQGSWLFGQWLQREARKHHVPCIAARPHATLAERILSAVA